MVYSKFNKQIQLDFSTLRLKVVQEVSKATFEQSAQLIVKSIYGYTLAVKNFQNSLGKIQQVLAREFDFLEYNSDGLGNLKEFMVL